MANGDTIIAMQQALQALLQGRDQSPLAPVSVPAPDSGLIGSDTIAVPTFTPPPPVNADAIRAQFASILGAPPAPPVAQPNPLIMKVALALQGFGAGAQGQGPQFLERLQEQRERPQREYEAKQALYNQRQLHLGLAAEEAVQQAEKQRQGEIQQGRLAEFQAARQLGLEEFRQGQIGARARLERADKLKEAVSKRSDELLGKGVPVEFAGPIAEAQAGLRVWTPELIQAANTYPGAQARATLARTQAETAKTTAETALVPLKAREVQAQIGRIGVLNYKDLQELNPTSNKKIRDVFDFSINEAVKPLLEQSYDPGSVEVTQAVNKGRRTAVERLGGNVAQYDKFLQRVDSDPAFAAVVRGLRSQGKNELEILNLAKGKF